MRSAEEIIEFLKRSFNTPSTKDEKLKVVILCIIISTTFWFFSALNKSDYVTQINYPIKVVYNDSLYVALSDIPDKLPLEVTGGGWDLMTRSFGFSMEPLVIEVENPVREKYKLSSSLRQEIAPRLDPVIINYIIEDSLIFNIDERVSMDAELWLDSSQLKLASNYRITSSIMLEPNHIRITGPKSMLDTLVRPIKIDIGNAELNNSVDQKISIKNFGSNLISTDIGEVSVKFEVTEFMRKEIELPVYPINFKGKKAGIDPSKVVVSYEVIVSEVRGVDSLNMVLTADYFNLKKSDNTIPIEIAMKPSFILNPVLSQGKVKLKDNE
ncbi:YbbR-like domain-containing protein [Roseivirga echinicomitans]|uniref:YbbR-like domain-containing protein n=1 Tax=Roseivirga echinicomitans TaxID=296218 RepID=A0A150XD99_9BACT|nr:hypothetical protein [Roseivirga echinicomitans]KYG76671.1 hypothetical protein AWN68_06495 [Roseivirga echinicomitans]